MRERSLPHRLAFRCCWRLVLARRQAVVKPLTGSRPVGGKRPVGEVRYVADQIGRPPADRREAESESEWVVERETIRVCSRRVHGLLWLAEHRAAADPGGTAYCFARCKEFRNNISPVTQHQHPETAGVFMIGLTVPPLVSMRPRGSLACELSIGICFLSNQMGRN